jgi:DNA primase large subunit
MQEVDLESKMMGHLTRLNLNVNSSIRKEFDLESASRKDNLSHFVLRLAYCRTEDLRRWFVNQECALLRLRLEKLSSEERKHFMQDNNLEYHLLSAAEKDELLDELEAATSDWDLGGRPGVKAQGGASLVKTSDFFKVPFEHALDLVKSRAVLLRQGFAYVPVSRVVTIVVAHFGKILDEALSHASKVWSDRYCLSPFDQMLNNPILLYIRKNLPFITSDVRLAPLLLNMSKQYVGPDYAQVRCTLCLLGLPATARLRFLIVLQGKGCGPRYRRQYSRGTFGNSFRYRTCTELNTRIASATAE